MLWAHLGVFLGRFGHQKKTPRPVIGLVRFLDGFGWRIHQSISFHNTYVWVLWSDLICTPSPGQTKSPVTLAEARRGIGKDCIAIDIEATSSTRLEQHDPWTILSCLTSLWARHLQNLWQMNRSRRGFLPDAWSFRVRKSHLRCGGKTTWLPKSTRKLHTSFKDSRYPKTEMANIVFKLLHRGESTFSVFVSWFEGK